MNRQWLVSAAIKLFAISVLPIGFEIFGDTVNYSSILITIGTPMWYLPGLGESNIIIAAIVFGVLLSPIIAFNYYQYHKPRTDSVGRGFVLAFLYSQQFVMLLLIAPLMITLNPSSPFYSDISIGAIYSILIAPWGLLFFVILPYFLREMEPRVKPMFHIGKYELRFLGTYSKNSVAALLLSLCITVFPFYFADTTTVMLQVYPISGDVFVSGIGLLSIDFSPFAAYASFSILSSLNSPLSIIVMTMYLYYIREIFKFIRAKSTRQRAIILGIVITLLTFPVALIIPPIYYQFVIPIPSTLLVSIAIIFFVDPLKAEELWDGTPHEMWFEPEKEETGKSKVPKVRIPIWYLIRSKLKRSRGYDIGYDWDKQEEDVFESSE